MSGVVSCICVHPGKALLGRIGILKFDLLGRSAQAYLQADTRITSEESLGQGLASSADLLTWCDELMASADITVR